MKDGGGSRNRTGKYVTKNRHSYSTSYSTRSSGSYSVSSSHSFTSKYSENYFSALDFETNEEGEKFDPINHELLCNS